MDTLRLLDILGFVIGIVYLILEYRASIWLWVAGVIMPAVDMILYYKAGLYADFGMAIYYCLAAVYGVIMWKFAPVSREQKESAAAASDGGPQASDAAAVSAERPIRHFKKEHIAPAIGVFFACWAIIWGVLNHFTDSSVPITDSFTTALSILAMWALAQKYVEQWLLWLGVDIVCCVLYVYKDIPFKAAIYGLYTIFAVFGYLKWRKMAKKSEKELG